MEEEEYDECTGFNLKASLKKCYDKKLDDHRIIILLCRIDKKAHKEENQKEIYWLYSHFDGLEISPYVWDTLDTAVECLNYDKNNMEK
jgi:hypothetical protein